MNNPTQNGANNGQPPTQPPTPSPTVPLTVYRELAAELQATKALMDSLHNQNQTLTQQNQQLHRELERIGQSVVSIQQIASSLNPNWGTPTDADRMDAEAIAARIRPGTTRGHQPRLNGSTEDGLSSDLFTEQGSLPHKSNASSPKDLSGLWLWMVILGIIVTAFAAGFMFVRPLIPANR